MGSFHRFTWVLMLSLVSHGPRACTVFLAWSLTFYLLLLISLLPLAPGVLLTGMTLLRHSLSNFVVSLSCPDTPFFGVPFGVSFCAEVFTVLTLWRDFFAGGRLAKAVSALANSASTNCCVRCWIWRQHTQKVKIYTHYTCLTIYHVSYSSLQLVTLVTVGLPYLKFNTNDKHTATVHWLSMTSMHKLIT